MRILIVSEFFPKSESCEFSGGVEHRAYHVARELAKKHEVTILAAYEKGAPKVTEFSGIKVIRCGKQLRYTQKGNILGRLSFIIDSARVGRKLKADIVDGYNFMSYPQSYFIGKSLGAPKVITYHDVWVGKWIKHIGPSGLLMEFLERYVLFNKGKKWDKFITNSNFTKNNLVNVKIPAEKIQTVYCGVDLDSYKDIYVRKFERPTVCFIGRWVDYKRVDDLIKAINIVKKDIPNIQLKLIGSGPEENKLKGLVKELNLEDNVDFVGFVEKYQDVMKILKRSHVFSLPSIVEGQGIVTVEAMACGVPYVNSRIGPTVEITDNGKGGLLFEPKNYGKLATQLLRLFQDKDLYVKCVKEEKKLVKNFDWKNLAKEIENVYKDVIKL